MAIGLVIPIDNYFNIFTPSVHHYIDLTDPNIARSQIDLSLYVEPYGNSKPDVTTTFSRTRCDLYEIASGSDDRIGVLTIPFDSVYLNKSIVIGTYFEPSNINLNGMIICVPYQLQQTLNVTLVPSNTNPLGMRIDYTQMEGKSFNVTMNSWEKTSINDVSVLASVPERTSYNATYMKWTQSFRIINNDNQSICLRDFEYFGLLYEGIDKSSVKVYFNGQPFDGVNQVYDTLNLFSIPTIRSNSIATFDIQFIATNSYMQ